MMTPQMQIETAKPIALQLCKAVLDASAEHVEVRRAAGRKASWSNHTKLKEGASFTAFAEATERLAEFLRGQMPPSLEMDEFGFVAHRKGTELRWTGKRGKAQGGYYIRIEYANRLYAEIGFHIAAAALSQAPVGADARARIEAVGLSPEARPTFLFQRSHGHIKVRAASPVEGYARALLTGRAHFPQSNHFRATPEAAYLAGAELAALTLERHIPQWSVVPDLWDKVKRHPAIKPLLPDTLKARNYTYLAAKIAGPDLDLQIATLLDLADQVKAPHGPQLPFLILRGKDQPEAIQAWCGTSAILTRMLRELVNESLVGSIETWQVFAMGSECGSTAREAVANSSTQRCVAA